MASRNGLTPKIRGPKGVGFGRTLPAPFGWGNAVKGDGTDDYMTIVPILNDAFPDRCSFEFWTHKDPSKNTGVSFYLDDTDISSYIFGRLSGSERSITFSLSSLSPPSFIWTDTADGSLAYIVLTLNRSTGEMSFWVDGVLIDRRTGSNFPINIKRFFLLRYATEGFNTNSLIDEFRFYKSILTDIEIQTNYNSGIGANPSITESLLTWYVFEQFEMLDFSALQDNSDIRLGMRDMSGMNNHAQPMNMQTNPALPNYVLQPFI